MSEQQILLNDAETINELAGRDLKVIQPLVGYRFSIDPVLLCSFSGPKPGMQVADLGTGNGVIPLLLAGREKTLAITGLEYQPDMADRARRSVVLNGLEDRILILEGDVRHLPPAMPTEGFDLVLMNPPYRPRVSGRIAPDDERAAARHELAGTFSDFLQAAVRLLHSRGRICLVFLAERLTELLIEMHRQHLEPKRLRLVHARQGQGAKLVLVEGRKGARPGLQVEPPLFIYKGQGRDYTTEVLRMYE